MWRPRFLNKAFPFILVCPDFLRAEVQMVQCRLLEGTVMGIVVAHAEDGDVRRLVIRVVVIDVVKVRTDASGFAHATHASICCQKRSLKRIGDMLPWHGIHPRRIEWPQPYAQAKLPGPPATTLKLGKPGWRPRSASAVGSARTIYDVPLPPKRNLVCINCTW